MPRFACLLAMLLCAAQLSALLQPPVRAGYRYPYATAYSAGVELPAYAILDLGEGLNPVGVNDALSVLLAGPDHTLIRWRGGAREELHSGIPGPEGARLNELDSVFMIRSPWEGSPEIAFWSGNTSTPVILPVEPWLLPDFSSASLYALNDLDTAIVRLESADAMSPFPPHYLRIETCRLRPGFNSWEPLAVYDYFLDVDFSFSQGGVLYQVSDYNNYGRSVGEAYEDSASTPPFSTELEYGHQYQYFTIGQHTVIDFEPFQINDAGTVVGRSPGPLHGLVVQDAFGQREIGPYLPAMDATGPLMSNPADGFEEIVAGGRYFKRMSERDLFGNLNGQPAPDFWHGHLHDLVPEPGGWSGLTATCISASGRIAGTGSHHDPDTGEVSQRAFLLLPQALIPDWNRDGRIDALDHRHAARGLPWRFWINDDNDAGDLAASSADDLPGSSAPDWQSPGIDGLRDVVDFFPVHLDLQALLRSHPDPDGVSVLISQADSALNFVYTSLHPEEVGDIHRRPVADRFGAGFDEPLASAATRRVTAEPVELDPLFLRNLRHENRGVLLFEGAAATVMPLVMEFRYAGETILTHKLPLAISPVRDMFRVLNLRQADPKFGAALPGPWLTDLANPPNLPDTFLKEIGGMQRTLVQIHGFNWSGADIPAGHAEVFKRFFQSGSLARFVGVSWFGDQGTLELLDTSFDYNENVINAFVTAALLKDALAGFAGPTTSLFAHSLGNMVASSAVADHGLQVANYFMLNAAVPNEAYLGEQDDRRLMVHPDWKNRLADIPDYPEWLLAANWSRLFDGADRRSRLTWKERFARIAGMAICLNFHSTGEDILQPGNGAIPDLFEKVWKREQIWVYNEMNKGTTALSTSLTGDVHGGWAFNRHYMTWKNPGGGAHPPGGEWVPMSTGNASLLDPADCVTEPFFRRFSSGDGDFPAWGDGAWLYQDSATANARLPDPDAPGAAVDPLKNHAKVLAEGLPAHSAPAGATPLPNLLLLNNFDMDALYRDSAFWPDREPPAKRDRWLHGDYLYPALPQVSGLYQKCVEYINHTVQP